MVDERRQTRDAGNNTLTYTSLVYIRIPVQ